MGVCHGCLADASSDFCDSCVGELWGGSLGLGPLGSGVYRDLRGKTRAGSGIYRQIFYEPKGQGALSVGLFRPPKGCRDRSLQIVLAFLPGMSSMRAGFSAGR